MNEYEIREMCEAFFDAYENRRVDVLDHLYSDDCIIWHNVYGRETTRDENLARYHEGYAGQRRRTYNDRIVNTFDDGFVIQYTLNGVMHTGHRGALWICIVAHCRDGQITRIDEYMDSSSQCLVYAARRQQLMAWCKRQGWSYALNHTDRLASEALVRLHMAMTADAGYASGVRT